MKPLHECDTAQDHRTAHDERADESPDQNAMLRARRNTKMRKDEHKNKNVVHAQRILDEVTGKKIERVVRSLDTPDQGVKCKRDNHPQETAPRRSGHAQFAVAQAEREEIVSDCIEYAIVERTTKPDVRRHGGH